MTSDNSRTAPTKGQRTKDKGQVTIREPPLPKDKGQRTRDK
ncbi:hypothetical protein [[Phormidium] sp. ETS-05]|nr:hypothetical protein [[Phormidium] sp. ETS-05]